MKKRIISLILVVMMLVTTCISYTASAASLSITVAPAAENGTSPNSATAGASVLTDGVKEGGYNTGLTVCNNGTNAWTDYTLSFGASTTINAIKVYGANPNGSTSWDIGNDASFYSLKNNGSEVAISVSVDRTNANVPVATISFAATTATSLVLSIKNNGYVSAIYEIEVVEVASAPESSDAEPETSKDFRGDNFFLDIDAPSTAKAGDIIDVTFTMKDIKVELCGLEFFLEFDETKLDPVIKENANDEMNAFMTKVPMYVVSLNGFETTTPRYEQMCRYNKETSLYELRFVDLVSYPFEKPGQTYRGLLEDGDFIITIPFKVLDTVSHGDELVFEISDPSKYPFGFSTQGLESTYGYADTAVVTIDSTNSSFRDDNFFLDIEAPSTAKAGDIIDVTFTMKDIKVELCGLEFFLEFDATKLDPVIKENGNDEMNAFMTKVPMYVMSVNGIETSEPRFEQMCRYNTETSLYELRFVDLISYPFEKPGQTYRGLLEDGDLIITIPFKVLDTVSHGDELVFEISDPSEYPFGPSAIGFNTKYGYADTAVVTIDECPYFVDDSTMTIQDVKENETAGEIISNLRKCGIEATIKYANGEVVADDETARTGSVVTTSDGKTYYIVILGDVDGNGQITSTDYLLIKAAFYGVKKLDGIYYMAANIDKSDELSITDYLKVKAHMLGVINLFE